MNSKIKNRRVITVILLLAAVAVIIYLLSLALAYPLFQNSRLADPLAELHSLFPLHYVAIGIMALLGGACFVFRIENRGIHLLLLLLLAIMLWYTPYYLAEFTRPPDGPRNLGVALQIPWVLHGIAFPNAGYGLNFPNSYILDYTLLNVTGIENLSYLHLFPFISIFFFVLLCYTFASKLFSPLAAFTTVLLAMIGLHYIVFHPSAHAVGMLLLMTALVLLFRQDTASRVLTFLAIVAVVTSHPISPLILAVFLAAALIAYFPWKAVKSQVVVAAMLVFCLGGWFIWPTLPLATSSVPSGMPSLPPGITAVPVEEAAVSEEASEWAQELQGHIFPAEFTTTKLYLLGTPFIYEGIYNLNKGIYFLYALLAVAAISYIFYRSRSRWKAIRDFLKKLGGLNRGEIFMLVSAPLFIMLTILLGEKGHVLIERGLTFTILALAGVVASITTRVYEPAAIVVKRFIGAAMVIIILFLTLSFPLVNYSIDAYTSFPISEEAGLKFLANYAPLETKRLTTTAEDQIALYRPYILPPIPLRSLSSLDRGDFFAFRLTGYYYIAMREEPSFEDNWFTRYRSVVNSSRDFDQIYSSPTTTIFIKKQSDG